MAYMKKRTRTTGHAELISLLMKGAGINQTQLAHAVSGSSSGISYFLKDRPHGLIGKDLLGRIYHALGSHVPQSRRALLTRISELRNEAAPKPKAASAKATPVEATPPPPPLVAAPGQLSPLSQYLLACRCADVEQDANVVIDLLRSADMGEP